MTARASVISWPTTTTFPASNIDVMEKPLESIAGEFLDSYLCWREACEDVRAAYQRWATCEPPRRAVEFNWYRAALDWEEHAARVHSQLADRLRAAAL
jgi:hypothetical protein